MLKPKKAVATIGVIVGRFQVPRLHEVHKDLVEMVLAAHPKVLIFLGVSPCLNTRNNPLDFKARKEMILEAFPMATVLPIEDRRSDKEWSRRLDEAIKTVTGAADSVLLYGGRDSFISHYEGTHPTQELESDRIVSGTELRKAASEDTKNSPDFRDGVIWASYNRYPTSYATIDVAIIDHAKRRILLGRKAGEALHRFIGGFVDPTDPCYEAAARREVEEELHVEIGDPEYVCSARIDDWRYRHENDKVLSILFAAEYTFGAPRPDDDIVEARWFTLDEAFKIGGENDVSLEAFVEEHRVLAKKLYGRLVADGMFKEPMKPAK